MWPRYFKYFINLRQSAAMSAVVAIITRPVVSHVTCVISPQPASNHLWSQHCHAQSYQHRKQHA